MKTKAQISQYNKTYYLKHKDTRKQASKLRYQDNRAAIITKTGDAAYKRKYGLTKNEKDSMCLEQDNKCLICNNLFTEPKHTHIDHCHKTGIIRGILCAHCNRGLGMFKDNTLILQRAIDYLNNNEKQITELERALG